MSLITRLIERWKTLDLNPWDYTPPTDAERELLDVRLDLMTRAGEAQEAGDFELADEYWAEISRLEAAFEHMRTRAWEKWREEMKGGN